MWVDGLEGMKGGNDGRGGDVNEAKRRADDGPLVNFKSISWLGREFLTVIQPILTPPPSLYNHYAQSCVRGMARVRVQNPAMCLDPPCTRRLEEANQTPERTMSR